MTDPKVNLRKYPIMRWRWRVVRPVNVPKSGTDPDDQAGVVYLGDGTMISQKSVAYRWERNTALGVKKSINYGGGMMTAPQQDRLAEDGEVTVVLFHGKGRLKTLMVFPSIFKGEHVNHKEMVAVHTGKEISVTFDRPTALQIDGETVLNVTNYKVKAGTGASVSAAEPATV